MRLPWLAITLLALATRVLAESGAAPIDWQKARELHQKEVAGEALTTDEKAYLERAMAERRARPPLAPLLAQLTPAEQQQVRVLMQKRRDGVPLNNDDLALQEKVQRLMAAQQRGPAADTRGNTPAQPPRDHTGLVPLTDMTAGQNYHGHTGGLYGDGRNEPPPAHAAAALAEAKNIVPLDPAGKPVKAGDANGKIGFLSVGMSNTTQEFSRFKERADSDPAKAPAVVLVDGAQGGQAAAQWAAAPDSQIWKTVDARLASAGVTAAQVQVAWLKQAEIRPTEPFPRDAEKLAADEATIVRMLKAKFGNLRIVYLSSRIYAGYATTGLNPEPYAYDSGFAVRMLIERQIKGDAELNWDASHGPVKAPLLLWGPYLWADGLTPRADGLVWKREDLREDGTHPSVTSGRDKVAALLRSFLQTDPTARLWYMKP